MEQINITAYVDDFGSVLDTNSIEPFGMGFFICENKDIEPFNEQLKEQISEKIHLGISRGNTQKDMENMVRKIDIFLNNCNMSYHAGGIIVRNIETNSTLMKEDSSSKLGTIIAHGAKLCAISIARKYNNFNFVNFTYIVEHIGNRKDFKKRTAGLKSFILSEIQLFEQKAKPLWNHLGLPSVALNFRFVESKDNTKASQLADAFAHLTKRGYRKEDSFSQLIYKIMENHFNLYKDFPNKGDLRNESEIIGNGIFVIDIPLEEIKDYIQNNEANQSEAL